MEGLNGLKELRKHRGLTQSELAEKIGIDENTIIRYENGTLFPARKRLLQLQDLLGCSFDELIVGVNPPSPPAPAGGLETTA